MKVALIFTSFFTSGPSIFTRNLAVGLQRLDVQVHLFYFDQVYEIEMPFPKTRLSLTVPYDFSNFDIVHSTGFRPDIYNAFVAKGARKRKITGIHNFLEEDLKAHYSNWKCVFGGYAWVKAIKRIKNIVVSSEQMKHYYEQKFSSKVDMELIPYGIDYPPKKEQAIDVEDLAIINTYRERGLLLITAVGVLYKRKGFDTLIAAVSKCPKYALLLIGDGPEGPALKILAAKLNVADRVSFLGKKKDSARYYNYCDIYAHTSFSEGFGLAMLEALARGIPIVCANLDIYDNYFEPGDVVRFEPGDIEGLALAIDDAKSRSQELSGRSANAFLRHFTLEKMAQLHVTAYKEILHGAGRMT
jgi:glycosyltransferase involved in cell wall biosynthesis